MNESKDVETALKSLPLREAGVDRDRLMYLAGAASVAAASDAAAVSTSTWRRRLRRRFWPAAACVSTTAAVVLGALLASRPAAPVAMKATPRNRTVVDDHPSLPATVAAESREPVAKGIVREEFDAEIGKRRDRRFRLDGFANVTADSNYIALREFALEYGVDALPDPVAHAPRGDFDASPAPEPLLRAFPRRRWDGREFETADDYLFNNEPPSARSIGRAGML